MDYKQKYETALENLKKIKAANKDNKELVDFIEYEYPELKENMDEKIRKELIKVFEERVKLGFEWKNGIPNNAVLAWLEKQGEQKSADKTEPKFKVGDIMRTFYEAANGITDGMPVVVSIDEKYYHCTNELISIKYQDIYEYPPINRRQNSAWSEEDEQMIEDIIEAIDTQYAVSDYNEMVSWFKSLKNRYAWKPTDEQMKALLSKLPVIKGGGDKVQDILESLYEDLKKLREE